MSEREQVAPLREQIAAAIDPLSFSLDYETRHRHCSPWKIEFAQQKWFERADAVIALLIKNGVRPEAPAGVRESVIEECAKVAEGTAPISSGNFFAARRDQCAKIAAKIRNLASLDPVRRTTQPIQRDSTARLDSGEVR